MLRSVILQTWRSSQTFIHSKNIGSATEQAFPKLNIPFEIEDASAYQRSEDAEKSYLKTLFACQSGGGDKGIHKHVVVNKKMLVRDRIRHILDDHSDFFELCPTAGNVFVRSPVLRLRGLVYLIYYHILNIEVILPW